MLMLVISSLIIGCVDNTNKYNLSSEEQKLVGTWKIDTNMIKGSIKFNSDKTGTFSTQLYGNIFFKWNAQNGKIYSRELSMIDPLGNGIIYKIVNNDKTLVFGGMNFDKSWW